ncbi:hypothetical protein BU26DRAFT_520502 [Trematosphaeria pertusa]|uniref:Uncharacterized protein n=1 Tax=Trematosphaeria pertusa TaxID=390896 RepID=A0A6A6IA74_9PLEO|nr:uncharacterized protein BU26DRAFT_520502 [Trematosphaeria pertusa]KAF2247281.1 hypothetical protein BU26DRAFT_520502 [Trematosphaeria pertusa]
MRETICPLAHPATSLKPQPRYSHSTRTAFRLPHTTVTCPPKSRIHIHRVPGPHVAVPASG